MRKILLLLSLMVWNLPDAASANVRVLPRKLEDFDRLSRLNPVDSVWVEGSVLAWVNYTALRRDFPALHKYSDSQIDQLLIQNFSYISKHQLNLNGIRNTVIPADSAKSRTSYRPSTYQRADVMEFCDFDGTPIGLVDRKGAGITKFGLEKNLKELGEKGAEVVQTMDHSDGLMSLGEGIVETTRERARQRLYHLERTNGETVETYFVMMFPFQIMKGHGSFVQAGLYARQAHLGRVFDFRSPLPASESSAHQQDFFGAGVDQGLVEISDPRLRSTFGSFGHQVHDSQKTADWVWAHDTASAFASSRDRSIVHRHVTDMIAPLGDAMSGKNSLRGADTQAEFDQFFTSYSNSQISKDRELVATALAHIPSTYWQTPSKSAKFRALLLRLLQDESLEVRSIAVGALDNFAETERRSWIVKLSQDRLEVVNALLLVAQGDPERAFTFRQVIPKLSRRDPEARKMEMIMRQFLRISSFEDKSLAGALETELNLALKEAQNSDSIIPLGKCEGFLNTNPSVNPHADQALPVSP